MNRAGAEMNKLVQQVAANAEESTYSPEEMNALASQFKGFPDERVGLAHPFLLIFSSISSFKTLLSIFSAFVNGMASINSILSGK